MNTKLKTFILLAGTAIGAAAVADTATVCTFESGVDGWTGGTRTAGGSATAPANGYAVTDADHAQVLAVDGTATRAAEKSGCVSVDMLFQVSIPKEEPALPAGESFAVAVATDGRLVAFTNSTDTVSLGDETYTAGKWLRLTTLFDYENSCCQVALNGELACGGAWLPIATASLAGITVNGTTAIDDVVVQNTDSTVYDKYTAVKEDGAAATVTVGDITVPANYLTVNNLAATEEAASATIANSSPTMTVAQAYQVGIAPDDGATFTITQAEPTADGIVLTFPGSWPADSYTVVAGDSPTSLSALQLTPVKDGNANKATIPFPDSGVLYYKVGR